MSEWLKVNLAKSGLGTLSNLAAETGINKGTLSRYFRGVQRPSIDVVAPLSHALQVSPIELLIGLGAIHWTWTEPAGVFLSGPQLDAFAERYRREGVARVIDLLKDDEAGLRQSGSDLDLIQAEAIMEFRESLESEQE